MGHEFQSLFERMANGKGKAPKRQDTVALLLGALTEAGREMTKAELIVTTGVTAGALDHAIHQAKRRGLVVARLRGRCEGLYRAVRMPS